IKAWSRLFALLAMAWLVMASLGSKLIRAQGPRAQALLRRVVSRRRGRCELGLVSAMVSLLQGDKTLYNELCPHVKLKLEATLENVSRTQLKERRTRGPSPPARLCAPPYWAADLHRPVVDGVSDRCRQRDQALLASVVTRGQRPLRRGQHTPPTAAVAGSRR